MSLPRFGEINGRRYLWRDLVALRQSQACSVPNAAEQDTGYAARHGHDLPSGLASVRSVALSRGSWAIHAPVFAPGLPTTISMPNRGAVAPAHVPARCRA
jgi:hypothetical protein